MFVLTYAVIIIAARGGSSTDVNTKQRPIEVCSHAARLYPHPDDCRKFIRCINRKQVSMSCPSKTVFDPALQICIWREDVNTCGPEQHEVIADTRHQQNLTQHIPIADTRHQQNLAQHIPIADTRHQQNLAQHIPIADTRHQQNLTQHIPIPEFPRRSKGKIKSSSASKTSSPRPVTYISSVAWSKSKNEKAERGFSMNKVQEDNDEYRKQRLGYPTSSSAVRVGSKVEKLQLKYKNNNLLSSTVATVSDKPANTARNAVVIPESGNKWYHTMNTTSTVATSTLSSARSQTISAASNQSYQYQQFVNLKDVDGKLRTNKSNEINDSFLKQVSSISKSSDAREQKHLRSGVMNMENNNVSKERFERIVNDEKVDHYENNTERTDDKREVNAEGNQGFTSVSVNNTQNDTGEINNSKMINNFGDEGNNTTPASTWVRHASTGVAGGKSARQTSGSLSLHNDFQLNVESSTNIKNKSYISQSVIPHSSSNSVEDTIGPLQISPTYHQNKETATHSSVYNDTNLSLVENTSADNTSFEDVSKLIEPYRVRLDRKSNKRTTEEAREIPGDVIDDDNDENTVDNEEMWSQKEVKILPRVFEHLTAKIVNRNELVSGVPIKSRWYDKKQHTDTPDRHTTPTTDSTDKSSANNNESQQHVNTKRDNLFTPSRSVLLKFSDGKVRETQYNKDEQKQQETYTELLDPAIIYPVRPTANNELPVAGEFSVDTVPALPDTTTDARLLSAPYLVTGLERQFRCPEVSGHFPDATNCAVYYRCSSGQAFKRECPPGQVFHSSVKSCVSSSLVPACVSAYTDAGQDDESFAKSVCKDPNGLYKDKVSCAHYFECTNGWPIRRQCMMGTVFDDVMKKCSWSKFVPGCEHQTTPEVEIKMPGTGHVNFQCPRDGYFRDPQSCDVYYLCAGSQALRMTCDPGTSFDVTLNMCVWSHMMDDCSNQDDDLENTVAARTSPKSSPNVKLERDISESPQEDFQCPEKNGIFPEEDCGVYYVCADGVARQMNCPQGLGFDVASGLCLEREQLPQCVSPRYQEPRDNTSPFSCPEAHGLYSDSSNCSFFIHCFKKVAYRHECQPGTRFSPTNAACTWSQLVPECQKSVQDKAEVSEKLNTKFAGYKRTGHGGVHSEAYQPNLIEPTSYTVQHVEVQDFICPHIDDGFFRDNVFCDIFHRCVVGKKFTFTCPAGTFFRKEETLCDFWEAVPDCTKDGIRLQAMGSLPDVVALSQEDRVQQQLPDQFEFSIVNIDADPTGCPGPSGLFPHPRNCRQFVFCSRFVPLVLICPEPLLFNSQTLTCDFAMKVTCFRSIDYRRK